MENIIMSKKRSILGQKETKDTVKKSSEKDKTQKSKDKHVRQTKLMLEHNALKEELKTANEKLLRSLAEVENIRRRTEKEMKDAYKYGASTLARDLLNVSNNLQMALMAISKEDKRDNEKLKNLAFGLDMVLKEFMGAFEKNGIKKIDPKVGENFDYEKHQAMGEVETADVEKGKIVETLSVGYTIHDRLLKPAMVNVAKSRDIEGKNNKK